MNTPFSFDVTNLIEDIAIKKRLVKMFEKITIDRGTWAGVFQTDKMIFCKKQEKDTEGRDYYRQAFQKEPTEDDVIDFIQGMYYSEFTIDSAFDGELK
jgi:hypothetical protein